jgi:hypothetical protein
MSAVSSDEIQKARRVALRGRSAKACIPCKNARSKCSDFRPCARCTKQSQDFRCVDEVANFVPACIKRKNLPHFSLSGQKDKSCSDFPSLFIQSCPTYSIQAINDVKICIKVPVLDNHFPLSLASRNPALHAAWDFPFGAMMTQATSRNSSCGHPFPLAFPLNKVAQCWSQNG